MAGLRERLAKDERGFSLSEMLVTIIIMMIVFFALFSIFDMSLKVFSFGNNKIEAVESARIGLEKMEREIRQAYKFNSASSQNHLFFTTASPTTAMTLPAPDAAGNKVVNQLTFGNDLSATGTAGRGVIQCGITPPCEYITYKLTDGANSAVACTTASVTCTLRRVNTSDSTQAGDPVVENVAPPTGANPNRGLSFTFLKSNGGTPANEGEVGMVLVKLNIVVKQGVGKSGTQTLTTVIDLRNR
jgi:Tfp pilus assembly protein PilW